MDGILAHNGEMLINKYEYNKDKTKEDFLIDLNNSYRARSFSKSIVPMTLEACVVRLADVIAYIGRDIEDAIAIGAIQREDIPNDIRNILGDNNSKIVDTLIKDIIMNSIDKPYITFSGDKFEALIKLLEWNYKYIYGSEAANKNYELIEELFNGLYEFYLKNINDLDFNNCTENEKALHKFTQNEEDKKRLIIDYIAGQTDNYFIHECELYLSDKYDLSVLKE